MALQNIVQIQAARKRQDRRRARKPQTVGEWLKERDRTRAALVKAARDHADTLECRPRRLVTTGSTWQDRQFVMLASALGRDEEGGA